MIAAAILSLAAVLTVSADTREFQAAALTWSAPADFAGTIRIRTSVDGETWSDWQTLAIDEDMTDRAAGRFFSGIISFRETRRFLEYSASEPVNAEVRYFEPLPARDRRRQRSDTYRLGAVEVVSRTEWGCPDGQGSRWTPEHTPITHTIVHHTAGSNDAADWATVVRNVWQFHTVDRGWGDVGYNYLIDPNGVVYEGRAGGDGVRGAHFSCRNTNTVGVALLGIFSNTPPTPAAINSLKTILRELVTRFALDPSAITLHAPSTLTLSTISAHRDGNPGVALRQTCTITECPGDSLYALLPGLRAELAAPPPPPPTENPVGGRRRAVKP